MKIEEVGIDEISNHEKNPKQHPDKQLRLLQESIKRFGWTNPVILSADNTILAGHARVKAAIAAGNDTVPCIRTKLTGFDSVQVDALLSGEDIPDISEFIAHDPDSERAGASPWERMGGEPSSGVLFVLGALTCKIDTGTYNQFFELASSKDSLSDFIIGVLNNAD